MVEVKNRKGRHKQTEKRLRLNNKTNKEQELYRQKDQSKQMKGKN